MIQPLRIKYHHFVERWRREGFLSACKVSLHKNEEAVPVVKDLSTLGTLKPPAESNDLELVEFTKENFFTSDVSYLVKSEKMKVPIYFKKGYRMFALIRQGQIIADIWCVNRATAASSEIHPHLQWFGIDLKEDESYLFDSQAAFGGTRHAPH